MKDTLVSGVFANSDDAAAALRTMLESGIARDDISIVASEDTKLETFGIQKQSKVGEGAAIGGGVGGALGALVAGFTAVGALATGGIGLIAAGPLVAALAGAGAGAATGGLLGGLIGLGIPEHQVKFFRDAIDRGSVLVGVRVHDSEKRKVVEDIMDRYNARSTTTGNAPGRSDDANNDASQLSSISNPSGTTTQRSSADRVGATGIAAAALGGGAGATSTGTGTTMLSASEWARRSPLAKLFVEQLQDIYDAEKQLTEAMPLMRERATSPELVRAIDEHMAETRGQIDRLEQVFRGVGMRAEGEKCPAMRGLIAEAKELMELNETPAQRDAAIICAAQKIEHYEIGTYGCLKAYARTLSLTQAAGLLEQNLDEEYGADRKLTAIAESIINSMAAGNPADGGARSEPSTWARS